MVVEESALALEEIPKCLSASLFAFRAAGNRRRRRRRLLFEWKGLDRSSSGRSRRKRRSRRRDFLALFYRPDDWSRFDWKDDLLNRFTVEAALAHGSYQSESSPLLLGPLLNVKLR